MNEIWKDIPEYEGIYQINNFGIVKRIERKSKYRKNVKIKEKIIKEYIGTWGYKMVSLYKNNHQKTEFVHRLIAKTFIQNPNNYPVINHKDGNKLNNNINNLEWCTVSHNNKEAYRIGIKKPRVNAKKILQLTKDNKIIKEWNSASEVQKKLGYSQGNICEVCNGRRNSANGYVWKYKEGELIE